MGREQGSRRLLAQGVVCYLCGGVINDEEEWNRDHVPPQRFYGKAVLRRFNPNLDWLYTHTTCNSSYKPDEEYFVACLAGHSNTLAGRSVFDDFQRGVAQGHDVGLLRTILNQFGKVALADGSRSFSLEGPRIDRIIWKLTRGIHFTETGRVLSENVPKHLIMLTTELGKDPAEKYPYFKIVRGTAGMGKYPGVFDYKWLCVSDDSQRVHAIAMLLWDRLMAMALFHDPSCRCETCWAPAPLRHQS